MSPSRWKRSWPTRGRSASPWSGSPGPPSTPARPVADRCSGTSQARGSEPPHNVPGFLLHSPSLLAGDGDAGLVSDHDELRAVATAQLVEQPADVGLDRGHGQVQGSGDLD